MQRAGGKIPVLGIVPGTNRGQAHLPERPGRAVAQMAISLSLRGGTMGAAGHIELRGVRVHNLKSVDLDLPRGKLIVFCGTSGSGKSSLALDTLYAEGQRRYIESFSAYTRQFSPGSKNPRPSGSTAFRRPSPWPPRTSADRADRRSARPRRRTTICGS